MMKALKLRGLLRLFKHVLGQRIRTSSGSVFNQFTIVLHGTTLLFNLCQPDSVMVSLHYGSPGMGYHKKIR